MAIGTLYNEEEVVLAIASALETFYRTLIEKIDGLDIVKIMRRKTHIYIGQKLWRMRLRL